MLKLYFNTSFEGKGVLVGFEVGSAKKKNAFKVGQAKKYWGGGGRSPKSCLQVFTVTASIIMQRTYQNAEKEHFWCPESVDFPRKRSRRTPFFYYVTNSNSTPQKWRNFSYHHNYFNDCSSFICTAPAMIPNPELGIIWGAVQNAYCLLFPIVYSMMFE